MLIIALAGNRNYNSASINNQGSNGNYWSSSPNGINAYKLYFNSTNVYPTNSNNRANGFSLRCFKDLLENIEIMENSSKQQLLLDIFQAYFDARVNKRQTANALAFEAGYEKKLFKLFEDIIYRRYKIGPSICFVVEKPVRREIFAADFRDRIVHHLIFNYINPIFEKNFIYDSYSCRLGKGTSLGIKRVAHFIRSESENYQKDCWVLKLDIKGYFMSMDRNILYKKILEKLKAQKRTNFDLDLILYLIHEVIFNDPTKNCQIKGPRENWAGLARSKSLFFAAKDKGFPIGNLTSQLFGNIYLDEFDHVIREKFGIAKYGRYVDDMVFVHSNQATLRLLVTKVKAYLLNDLGLTLHPNKIYLQYYKKGLNFLGVHIKPYRIYINHKTKSNLYYRIEEWSRLSLSEKRDKKFLAALNSYLGIMQHYNTWSLRKKIVFNFADFYQISQEFKKLSLAKLSVNNTINV